MLSEKLKKNADKANHVLSGAVLLFLLLIPLIGILWVTGYFSASVEELVTIGIIILVLSIIPAISNKILYREDMVTTLTLLCMEGLFLLVSMNPYAQLTVLYVLVPVISMLYCNQRLTQRICLICYLGMVGVSLCETSIRKQWGIESSDAQSVYLFILRLTFEFAITTVVVCYGAEFLERRPGETENTVAGFSDSSETEHSDYRKDENQGDTLQEKVYDTESLFRGIEKDMLALIKGKDKFFELELDDQLPSRLFGAKEEIRQALSGLSSDLLMYRSEAAVRMQVTYNNGIAAKKNQNVTLEIRINAFTDITAITVNRAALGYFLSQRIIKQLKGSFEDLSNSEEAVFKICLLQRVEDEKTIREKQEQQLKEMRKVSSEAAGTKKLSFSYHKIKVLVVDDNKETCKLVDAILNSMGVQVVCVNHGAEAIEMLETQEYQLVFMDQMMPEKSGLETVKELRYLKDEYFQKLPIILMTVNIKEEARKEYMAMGFTDCISKPIKENEVKSSLRRWIKDEYPLTYAEYMKMQENGDEL